jgi:uncharacterized surface protein with fasciclin (FAS1) repeats
MSVNNKDLWDLDTGGEFTNETEDNSVNPDEYWEESSTVPDNDYYEEQGEETFEETSQPIPEVVNTKDKKKKKWLVPLIIVVVIVLFLGIKLMQAKKNPSSVIDNETTEINTEIVSINYDGFKQLVVLGTSAEYGIDYSTKTYLTDTGTSITYADLMTIDTIINQSTYSSLTNDAKKMLLTDILDISKVLSSSDTFESSYDEQLINEIHNLSYIDSTMFDGILSANGRNTFVESIETESDYDVIYDFDYSFAKLYDENGSNSVIVDYVINVDAKGEATLIVHTESAGNVESIPVKIGNKTYDLNRDNSYDMLNNGFILGYGYSHKLEDLQLGAEYGIFAYTNSARTEYNQIGALIVIKKGMSAELNFGKEQPTEATITDADEETTDTTESEN